MKNKLTKAITLEDIARQLNLSKVAVSKALRDHPDISRETKRLVEETAQKLGYVPNFIARNLSSQRSNTIGLVVPKIAHHFFARAIETIYETAFDHKYEIIMMVSRENAGHESRHIQTLLSMRVDGLLVSVTGQTINGAMFEVVRQRDIPLVFFDRVIEGGGFSCVTSNDRESTYNSITEILERGFHKIGHLAGPSNTSIGRNRLAGFRKAFQDKRIAINESWIIEGGFAEEDGYRGLHNLAKNPPLPEVLFTVTYPVALGVLLAAEELGIRIPQDLEIISFGGSSYNRFMRPSISYVEQPVEAIARTATELLIERIEASEPLPDRLIEIPAQLVFCETCIEKKDISS
jgi:LacI family transcriptional regulator